MVYKVQKIYEANYGCEERMPGQMLKVLLVLEDAEGNTKQIEAFDALLTAYNINEGDMINVDGDNITKAE